MRALCASSCTTSGERILYAYVNAKICEQCQITPSQRDSGAAGAKKSQMFISLIALFVLHVCGCDSKSGKATGSRECVLTSGLHPLGYEDLI